MKRTYLEGGGETAREGNANQTEGEGEINRGGGKYREVVEIDRGQFRQDKEGLNVKEKEKRE